MGLIVDAQVHTWAPEAPGRPWPPGGREVAVGVHGGAEFPVEALDQAMDSNNVDRAVLVPPFFEGFRNDYVLAAARAAPHRYRVMARVDPRDMSALAKVRELLDDPLVAGFRFVFLDADIGPLSSFLDHPIWNTIAKANRPVALFAPGQLAAVRELALRHPRLLIMLDHAGLSGQHQSAVDEATKTLQLASSTDIVVKLSALDCSTDPNNPDPVLVDVLRSLVQACGPDRLVWGSDLTRTPAGYKGSLALLKHVVTPDIFGQVAGGTLLSLLGWDH